jgi:hypothetical protein
MTKSKFSLWIFLIVGQVIIFSGGLILIFSRGLLNESNQPGVKGYLITTFLFIVLFVLVFSELRTKAIKVKVDNEKISVRNYLGLGRVKHYYFKDISGFKISFLPSTYTLNEFLYLMIKDRKVIKLSAFYHRNYTDLKEVIVSRSKDLGVESFSFIDEFIELFT